MSSSKRASLSSNSPLDQLFRPTREQAAPDEETAQDTVASRDVAAPQGVVAPRPATTGAVEQPAAVVVPDSAPPQQDGPPEPAEKELRQTTIMIYADQADWLDETAFLARRHSGAVVSKAAILRELVEMARDDAVVLAQLRRRLGLEGGESQ